MLYLMAEYMFYKVLLYLTAYKLKVDSIYLESLYKI